jgi:hypothetical protein
MAVPQRRRRVEPPDLAIAEFDFTNEVSDPDDRVATTSNGGEAG